MGIFLGIFWIIAGVFYIIYKIGEEELDLGKAGGVALVGGCVTVFFVLAGLAGACIAIADNDAEGGLLFWGIIFSIVIGVCIRRAISKHKREKEGEMSADSNLEEKNDHK